MSITTNILPYIPQRAPFIMISTLETCDDLGATTTFDVSEDNIFVQQHKLTESALIENIAQTAAARIGFICQQEKRPVPVGYIGAVQNLKVNQLPAVQSKLTTQISIKHQIFSATIIEGRIFENEKLIAQCDMKIFISE